jgi:hypothetical protein
MRDAALCAAAVLWFTRNGAIETTLTTPTIQVRVMMEDSLRSGPVRPDENL